MRRLAQVAGILLSLAASGYFCVFVYNTGTRYDARALFSWPLATGAALVALGYVAIIPISSWAWERLLQSMGVRIPLLRLNMILGVTQIAKYIPGNVVQLLGRSAMSIRRGVPPAATVVTLVVETALTFAAAIVVGVLGLCLYARGMPAVLLSQPRILGLAVLAAILALLTPAVVIRFLPAIARRISPRFGMAQNLALPAPSALAAAFAAYSLNYVLIGLGLYATVVAVAGAVPGMWALCIGVFALSWALGAVAPGVPAGLGVREGAMAAFLSPALGGPAALQVIIGFRIATTVGDLLALAWGGSIFLQDRMNAVTSLAPGPDSDH